MTRCDHKLDDTDLSLPSWVLSAVSAAGVAGPAGSAQRSPRACEPSVTDYFDLWLVHWPPGGQARPGVWRELLAAGDGGQAGAAGVSNYSIRQIDELTSTTGQAPAVNQIPWSPSRYDPRVLADSRERDVVVEGYSPLKGTNLRDRTLAEIASRHRVRPAQGVLRWHVEHGIPVIPKSADRGRIAANFDLFSFTLGRDEVARIDGLSRR